jgi:nitrogen regulatory protein PII
MYMIFFVLDNPDRLDEVLDGWEKAGIQGVTIVESTGIHRLRHPKTPMRYVYQQSSVVEEGHYTLMAIVTDQVAVQACLQATENLIGDLSLPDTGVFAAWPLITVKGVPQQDSGQES